MSEKGGASGSVALLKESIQMGCVSQDSFPRMSILKKEKIGFKIRRHILQGHLAPSKKSGKKGSIARYYPKVCAS